MQALVICAYPGCGKTYYTTHNPPFSCEDSDSSLFSWKYVEDPSDFNTHDRKFIKTNERNPNFPQNYISHIKSLLYKRDVIFVSSHKVVRDALYEAEIPHVIVYPCREAKDEWMRRFEKRGSDSSFIRFQNDHWDEFHDEIENIKNDNIRQVIYIYKEFTLNKIISNPYISTKLIDHASTELYFSGIDTYPYFKISHPELYKSVRTNL